MNQCIQCDLYCVKCRYNLRTLRVDGRCPECGTLVQETLISQRNEPIRQLVGVFVAYLAINLVAVTYLSVRDRRVLFEIAPVFFFYGPLVASLALGGSRYFGDRLRWRSFLLFVAAMSLVGTGNLYVVWR